MLPPSPADQREAGALPRDAEGPSECLELTQTILELFQSARLWQIFHSSTPAAFELYPYELGLGTRVEKLLEGFDRG